jgi:hypothetical protein
MLWSNSVNGDKELWHSWFVSKRFPIDGGLLSDLIIQDDIFNKRFKLNSFTNRAIDFKALLSSQDEKGILRRLGGRIGDNAERATGRVRGFRAGATFDPNAVDADMDGFVQEGTQFARPAKPGVNTEKPISNISQNKPMLEGPKRSKLRSVGESLKSTAGKFHWFNPTSNDVRHKTRWIDRSSRIIDDGFEKQTKTIEDTYNDGKSINTIADAKSVISRLNPKTNIDFLRNSTDDSADLTPYQKSLFLGIAHGMHIAPQLQSVRITVKEQDEQNPSQGSQQIRSPIFGASGRRLFQVSRRAPVPGDDRRTREHGHIITYTGESHKASQLRGGRISPTSGRYQPGIFETSGWDLTSFRVAAAYIFEDEDDPDYKRFKDLADKIDKASPDMDPSASPTEEMQKEYEILKQLFAKALSNQSSKPDIDERIQAARLAMMRSVMIHEFGHAAHTEAAYQDAIKGAAAARDQHVTKYRTMLDRKKEIAALLSGSKLDQNTAYALRQEAADIEDELSKVGDMASQDYLDELTNSTGPELFPFYMWHELHGGGDKVKERKIAETILDRQAARAITDLLAPIHGAFHSDPRTGDRDLVPDSWLTMFHQKKKLELRLQRNRAMQNGDLATVQQIDQMRNALDNIVNQTTMNVVEMSNDELLDKSGRPVKMTREMHNTLSLLRQQTEATKGFTDAHIQELGADTQPGENLRVRDLLDFIALGSVYVNRKLTEGGGFDPDIGVNSFPHLINPDTQHENISIISTMLGNNFEAFSDIANLETRTQMAESMRRLGLINTLVHPFPFAASEDINSRLNSIIDSTSVRDTMVGSAIPNPLDAGPNVQYEMIEEALNNAMQVFANDRSGLIDSTNAGTLFTMAAIARHFYDDLTDEERAIAQKVSRYGGGTPQASYMSLITNIPVVELLKEQWGENRVELFSELAVINALQLTLYSADKDKDGKLVSRHLSEKERAVMRKLLSWYQNKAEFHFGSATLPKDR